MKYGKKIFSVLICTALGMTLAAGCSQKEETDETGLLPGVTYAFVAKDMQNPYMQKIFEGFKNACDEIGAEALYEAPESPTAQGQSKIIESLIEEKVDGIAIAANDENELRDVLGRAMEMGIKVISLDSAVSSDSRALHIQQADPEAIGRTLIQDAYDLVGGNGGIAILSATKQATNQNLWISYMEKEIAENPEKYASTPLKTIVYGDDDLTKSQSETAALIENPDVDVIIAPTTVGIVGAAQTLSEAGSDVKLTGLALPSDTAEYIESGVCSNAYLWNPCDVGYLATFAMYALDNGTITGAQGDTFTAGDLGEKTVTLSADGGTEVLLGELLKFDNSNIAEWKNEF